MWITIFPPFPPFLLSLAQNCRFTYRLFILPSYCLTDISLYGMWIWSLLRIISMFSLSSCTLGFVTWNFLLTLISGRSLYYRTLGIVYSGCTLSSFCINSLSLSSEITYTFRHKYLTFSDVLKRKMQQLCLHSLPPVPGMTPVNSLLPCLFPPPVTWYLQITPLYSPVLHQRQQYISSNMSMTQKHPIIRSSQMFCFVIHHCNL